MYHICKCTKKNEADTHTGSRSLWELICVGVTGLKRNIKVLLFLVYTNWYFRRMYLCIIHVINFLRKNTVVKKFYSFFVIYPCF